MANMSLVKTPMPEQDPKVRARNFKEVALGYTPEQAIEEANRCLKCKNPKCVGGCRVTVGGEVKFACVDGPEFDGHKVDFAELMSRNATYRGREAEVTETHACRMDAMGKALIK